MKEEVQIQPNGIRFDYPTMLMGVKNYQDIQTRIAGAIGEMKDRGVTRIGFASGSLGNRGPDSMWSDMQTMKKMTDVKQAELDIPILSSAHIFSYAWNNLEEEQFFKEGFLSKEERSERMKQLFRNILALGITDIFMLPIEPGWRNAPGSVDEYETAQLLGLTIHDLDPQ